MSKDFNIIVLKRTICSCFEVQNVTMTTFLIGELATKYKENYVVKIKIPMFILLVGSVVLGKPILRNSRENNRRFVAVDRINIENVNQQKKQRFRCETVFYNSAKKVMFWFSSVNLEGLENY
jgi:transcription termination factor Rho